MNTGFTTEVLAQKLARLNISQQSIETLSHWCVFHHRYFRQVVETWDSVFQSAPLERKISLLYLANDIMQNSKKDGMSYINEFWRVIAAALNDVFTNGDDFGRNVVQRLQLGTRFHGPDLMAALAEKIEILLKENDKMNMPFKPHKDITCQIMQMEDLMVTLSLVPSTLIV